MREPAGSGPVLGLVGSAAGGLDQLERGLVAPMLAAGWRVAVTLTPTAATWLAAAGQDHRIEELTGLPVRSRPRLPTAPRPHPDPDVWAVVPASANTVAKLACGVADSQALTAVGEAIGDPDLPVVIFPRINRAHAGHPAWPAHLDRLGRAGVRLIYGADVWPLQSRGAEAPDRELPWPAIVDTIVRSRPT